MKQKKLLFTLSMLALNAAILASCGGKTSGVTSNITTPPSPLTPLVSPSTTPNPSTSTSTSSSTTPVTPDNEVKNHTLFAHKEGITRFEAEEVDVTKYVISSDNPTKVVERTDASNGKFLAASTGDTAKNSTFEFNISLDFDATITMAASYAQSNKWKDYDQDLTKSYTYIVDENRNMMLSQDKTVLSARTDITKWEEFSYTPITLNKGTHTFSVKIAENTGKGNPNIDYLDFNIIKVTGGVIDDDKVPENDFHSSIQYKYISDTDYENVSKYANGVTELSKPKGIVVDFKDENISSNSFVLEYADNNDFENSIIVNNITSSNYAIQNLKLGQELYWRVTDSQSNLSKSKVHNIQVADKGPRNMSIDGVSNVRDVGGYKSSLVKDGKIKQGLYYRGANLNSITESGKKEMLRLGIKREIDMRDSYQCLGPYVDGISYSAISIPSGTESKRFEEFKDEYKQIFTLIANADKEPIYLHCTAGADRTGIATFMLLTLCGASYEDMARDYLFTNFSTQGTRVPNYTSEFKAWWSKLDNFEGNTKADKAKSWLVSKGVTAEQVEKIRTIFVENY